MIKIFISKRKSTKTGKEYTALFLKKDEKEYVLTFDKMTMLRISNMTLADFEDIAVGDVINI